MKLQSSLIASVALLLSWVTAQAQVIIVPPERLPFAGAYAVRSVAIDASVKDQVAQVQLAQVFRNNSSREMEMQFIFPIPPDATISQFTLMVDGRELPAKMYSKEEARRIYESIVRSKRDPALLEYVGYGMLQTSVFPVPAHAERKVTLRYSQLCKRMADVQEILFPLTSGKLSSKPVEELRITVRLENAGRIKSVYSPTYAVNVERPSDDSAIVRYSQAHGQPGDDFRLIWTLSEKPIGATMLSYRPDSREDGYFLLLASPEVKSADATIPKKTIIFALDKSGSMAGQKIEQAKNALRFVLNNLRDGDTFNIVTYDDRVETFKPELQRYDSESRAAAMRFIDGITDGGSTNINGALLRAFDLVGDTGRPSYVIFMTDGLPTTGVQNETEIATNARNANRAKARLFAFGVGFDVNARLLDRLTTENQGTTEYVKPNENIEAAVSRFYSKMTAPVLTAIKIELAKAEINRTYPRDVPDLFAGGQVIVVGRYRTSGETSIHVRGRVGNAEQDFSFPTQLADKSMDDTYAFVEKLWASRRVGEILNELDLKGRNQELVDELVRLSTKHGILTPYTSFLADERTKLYSYGINADEAAKRVFVDKDTSLAGNTTGKSGVALREQKAELQKQAQAAAPGAQSYRDANGDLQRVNAVQVVGNKALYRRSNRWVDPSVTPDDEKKAIQVEQFSDHYFELARNNSALRKYLALPEGCTVRLEGQVYQINASRQN